MIIALIIIGYLVSGILVGAFLIRFGDGKTSDNLLAGVSIVIWPFLVFIMLLSSLCSLAKYIGRRK